MDETVTVTAPKKSHKKKKALGQRLTQYRLACGLSLRDIAPQLGVSPPTVLRCERGESISIKSYMAIGLAIGENEQDLFKEYRKCH